MKNEICFISTVAIGILLFQESSCNAIVPLEPVGNTSVLQPLFFFPSNNVHEDIVKKYEEQISILTDDIIRQHKLAGQTISGLENQLNLAVSDAVQTAEQDILIVRDRIKRELNKPANKVEPQKTCLLKQQINAEALNTNLLCNCLTSDTLSGLNDLRLNILELKAPVVTLVSSCRKLNPLDSQSASMEKCLKDYLATYTTQLSSTVKQVDANANTVFSTVNKCLTDRSLNKAVSDILNAVVKC